MVVVKMAIRMFNVHHDVDKDENHDLKKKIPIEIDPIGKLKLADNIH